MISGANDKELDIANARADIITKLDNTSTYESWLIIDTFIEQLEQERNNYKELYEKEKQKYKEVIDKAIDKLEYIIDYLEKKDMFHNFESELLDILKEVK